jgi:hypothetical protein
MFFFLAKYRQIRIIQFYFLKNGKIILYSTKYNHLKIVVIKWSGAKLLCLVEANIAICGSHSGAILEIGASQTWQKI